MTANLHAIWLDDLAPGEGATWHMTATQQITTLIIAVAVVAGVFIVFRSLWLDWQDKWSIEDLTEDFFDDADPHAIEDRAAMQARRAA